MAATNIIYKYKIVKDIELKKIEQIFCDICKQYEISPHINSLTNDTLHVFFETQFPKEDTKDISQKFYTATPQLKHDNEKDEERYSLFNKREEQRNISTFLSSSKTSEEFVDIFKLVDSLQIRYNTDRKERLTKCFEFIKNQNLNSISEYINIMIDPLSKLKKDIWDYNEVAVLFIDLLIIDDNNPTKLIQEIFNKFHFKKELFSNHQLRDRINENPITIILAKNCEQFSHITREEIEDKYTPTKLEEVLFSLVDLSDTLDYNLLLGCAKNPLTKIKDRDPMFDIEAASSHSEARLFNFFKIKKEWKGKWPEEQIFYHFFPTSNYKLVYDLLIPDENMKLPNKTKTLELAKKVADIFKLSYEELENELITLIQRLFIATSEKRTPQHVKIKFIILLSKSKGLKHLVEKISTN